MALLAAIAEEGSQAIVATHSPVIAAVPGATILELDAHGWRETTWEDLDLVADWRAFLDDPRRTLRHLVDDDA